MRAHGVGMEGVRNMSGRGDVGNMRGCVHMEGMWEHEEQTKLLYLSIAC